MKDKKIQRKRGDKGTEEGEGGVKINFRKMIAFEVLSTEPTLC